MTRTCSPVPINSAAYFGAAITFFLFAYLSVLPQAPLPFGGNLLQNVGGLQNGWDKGYILISVMWGFHYVRRFFEVLLVHRYGRTMPMFESVGAWIYYWVFGVWNGWAVNEALGFRTPPVPMFAIGVTFFIIGEIGNTAAHMSLRSLRTRPCLPEEEIITTTGSRHVIPSGFLFQFISCPHYLFEIISWIGFGLAAFTLPSLLLLSATVITLVIYSRRRHMAYKEEFDGKDGRPLYPTRRKALIPFLF